MSTVLLPDKPIAGRNKLSWLGMPKTFNFHFTVIALLF